jgi:hypothetical protein
MTELTMEPLRDRALHQLNAVAPRDCSSPGVSYIGGFLAPGTSYVAAVEGAARVLKSIVFLEDMTRGSGTASGAVYTTTVSY